LSAHFDAASALTLAAKLRRLRKLDKQVEG
jgi:hypothetical protein